MYFLYSQVPRFRTYIMFVVTVHNELPWLLPRCTRQQSFTRDRGNHDSHVSPLTAQRTVGLPWAPRQKRKTYHGDIVLEWRQSHHSDSKTMWLIQTQIFSRILMLPLRRIRSLNKIIEISWFNGSLRIYLDIISRCQQSWSKSTIRNLDPIEGINYYFCCSYLGLMKS